MLGVVSFLLYTCTTILGSWSGVELLPNQPLIFTPFIENGEVEKARGLSEVDPALFSGVKSYAGYFNVNKRAKWNLFSWFFPVSERPLNSTPLIIWLQGGPGHSSLFGLFRELGPIMYDFSEDSGNGTVLKSNVTWGSDYSFLFIDNPVGTGFSYTESGEYANNMDEVTESLLNLLLQFLEVFPELKTAPLFFAGEAYGARYITSLGRYILLNNLDPEKKKINMKGLMIGDGWIDPVTLLHRSELALQLGLLDHKQADMLHYMEERARVFWRAKNFDMFDKTVQAGLDMLHIFSPNTLENVLSVIRQPERYYYDDYLNKPEVQNAIHVKTMIYSYYNPVVERELRREKYRTSKPWLEEILEQYGVMCYNGQLDVIVGYVPSQYTFKSMNWTGAQAYRDAKRIALHDPDTGAVTGYIKEGGNFMDVLVRNSGQRVPADKPHIAKQIFDMFINKFK